LIWGAFIASAIWGFYSVGKINYSEYRKTWLELLDAYSQYSLLKHQLRAHNIPLPEGVKPEATMTIGNVTITF